MLFWLQPLNTELCVWVIYFVSQWCFRKYLRYEGEMIQKSHIFHSLSNRGFMIQYVSVKKE